MFNFPIDIFLDILQVLLISSITLVLSILVRVLQHLLPISFNILESILEMLESLLHDCRTRSGLIILMPHHHQSLLLLQQFLMLFDNDLIFLLQLELELCDGVLQLFDAGVQSFDSLGVGLPELLGLVVVRVVQGGLLQQALEVAFGGCAFYLYIVHLSIIFYS